MFKYILIAVLILALIALAACAASPSSSAGSSGASGSGHSGAVYRKITAQQAKARIDSKEMIILVDVRTKEEYEEKRIEGAILIPNESIASKKPEQLPDLDAEILIYCRSGNRSAQAAKKLVAMGYTKVYDFGGLNDWSYPTVSGAQK